MKDFLKRGLERLARLGRPDPNESRTDAEGQLKAIFDEMASQLREDQTRPRRGILWIATPRPDPDIFVAAAMEVLDQARAEAAHQAATAAYQYAELECGCRCRAHNKMACPKCVRYEACPLHSDVDPSTLKADLLADPVWVAQSINRELAEILPGVVEWDDDALDPYYREALVEAVARVVSARMI
jgi:hypothetical protein